MNEKSQTVMLAIIAGVLICIRFWLFYGANGNMDAYSRHLEKTNGCAAANSTFDWAKK